MTTLDNGVVVDESINAVHVTYAADVPNVFQSGPRRVENITIHHWGPLGQNFDTVVGYLASDNDRESSAHYIAMDGRATCIVTPDDAAWHAGTRQGNTVSIGIECRPEATDGDYATVAALVRFIRTLYGNVPLVPHNSWISTDCPGIWDLARLDALAGTGAIHPPVVPTSTPAPTPAAPAPAPVPRPGFDPAVDIHWHVEPGDTLGKIQAYYNGPSVTEIAAYNGITNPDVITAGSDVFIPGPLVWIIEAPDTLRTVAAYYGLDPDYLAHLNGLPNADATIYIGNTLKVL